MEISAPLSMKKAMPALFIWVISPATKYFVPFFNDATQIVFLTGAVGEDKCGGAGADATTAASAGDAGTATAASAEDADAATAASTGAVLEAITRRRR